MDPSSTQKRLKILEPDEIDAIYGRPVFTDDERAVYFSLSSREKAVLKQLHTKRSRLHFTLQLGYFKVRYQFFIFTIQEVEEDARYVQRMYFPDLDLIKDFQVSKVTRLNQQAVIRGLFGYRSCDDTDREQLRRKARQVARIYSKPIYIFRELMHYLTEHRLIAPGYSFMQDTVSEAIIHEENRLIDVAHQALTDGHVRALQELLDNPYGLYEITRLKREPKNFTRKEIKREIERATQLQDLYAVAQRVLAGLNISNESIKYYASLVTYYSVFRLGQRDDYLMYIYLLCFIYHRYQKLHDHLINYFIHYVRRFWQEARETAKDKVYEYRMERNRNLPKAGHILKLFTAGSITKETPFDQLQAQAFELLEPQQIDQVADSMIHKMSFDETAFRWEHIDNIQRRFKGSLRFILPAVQFAGPPTSDPLLEAIAFLREVVGRKRSLRYYARRDELPTGFIPDHLARYLYTVDPEGQTRLLADRYEFLVYQLLRHGLQSGAVYCRDSVRFRSLEDDLVSEQQWQQKENLIAKTELSILTVPIEEHLASLEQLLEERLQVVNQRILSGENAHVTIKKHGQQMRWSLPYPRGSEPVNHPFFDDVRQVDINTLLHFANQRCQFLDTFDHILPRYGKQLLDDRILIACLIAWGTNMGLGRMGAVSDIDYSILVTTSDNFIRLETLKEANDRISNAITQLPIFPRYDIDGVLHSSSDGQKFETFFQTINARHSPRYFGLKKGIVAYTLVANHIPINARIIGANEHESHYVFDLLFNNTTDLQPAIHSTDTHGTNEVNFAILHLFGYQFAPRYKDIYDKVRTSLYGFKHPSHYQDLLLKPIRKINTRLLIDEWDNFQRTIVSLALKTTTQSIIIGKLSSYTRKNRTRRALWEYDNIIRSLYLLNYVDSLSLRRNVLRALNRGENYHQMRRAVSYANFGKLRFTTEYDQQIWNECSRLLTNCILFYNASLLSSVLLLEERRGKSWSDSLLRFISPVAWQHINFYGRYKFITAPVSLNINAIVQELLNDSLTLNSALEA